MDVSHKGTFNKYKPDRILDTITSKSNKSFLKRLGGCFNDIKNFVFWVTGKIISFFSKCSMLTQLVIILIPSCFVGAILLNCLHVIFYQNLYIFNFEKGIKEEFSDLYETEIDDLHAELDGFVIKENYFDVGNELFFEIYFRELASIGLLKNSGKRTFPNISRDSDTLYSLIDDFSKSINSNDIYTIPKSISKKNIDDRKGDSIGELAKIYYYMIPILTHSCVLMNIFINQTFFIAYEFDNNKNIINNELFFTFPRNTDTFNENDNFTPNNILINPLVKKNHYDHSPLIGNSYYFENWFMKQDNDFRESVDLSNKEDYSKISLANLNNEYNGNINKSYILSLQQNLNTDNKHFIINIVFFFQQLVNEKNETNEFSIFILKNNYDFNNLTNEIEKYSDNQTYVILKSDIIEYTLTTIEYQYFHEGIYEKNNSFNLNGISFDIFNLDYLYNPIQYYSTFEDLKIDLKYFSALYLYKTLFQSIKYSIIRKDRAELFLYHFEDENKIKKICEVLDFSEYNDYLSLTGIDCWDDENGLYYDEKEFLNFSTIDSNFKIPICGCLPLFCLKNFKTIKIDGFNNMTFASKINLPSKCQNKFVSYGNESNIYLNNSFIKVQNSFQSLILSKITVPKNEYLKFIFEPINKLPGYYILIITKINSNTHSFIYSFYNFVTYIEINALVLGIALIGASICTIIVYVNLRRYSIIIQEYKKKYDLYIYHSDYSNTDDKSQKYKNEDNKKLGRYNNMHNENTPFLQNDNLSDKEMFSISENTLLDDLFSMFCKHYRISLKDIEKYYQQKKHETKNEMKLKMMMEKNELFQLLALFSVYAPIFRLNLTLDYKMYNYSKIIKKYDLYNSQMANINREQTRLTQNILYELLSTENISDYGLITNFNFKYVSNLNAEIKENSIKNSMFKNVINKMNGRNRTYDNEKNINDLLLLGDENQSVKLILKRKNELMEMFKKKFEGDDYINFNKIENSFNFFLVNSYYKYLKQIIFEGSNS